MTKVGSNADRNPMNIDLTAPMFHDEDQARAWLEGARWPDGVVCPHCGGLRPARMGGTSGRPGLFHCPDCRGQFTVRTGQVMERSKVPLTKWVMAYHLMASSKKGISAHQLHRTLKVAYNTAWFMAHRIREAMTDTSATPMGGAGKIVEADEAYHGKVETPVPSKHRRGAPYLKRDPKKQKRAVFALVERGGIARAFHMKRVTGDTVRDALVRNADRKSRLHTDESRLYPTVGAEFATHETVNHSAKEYARGDVTTNSVEGFFGILKRGLNGVYQHCGEQHFQRYLDEFAFRYSNRSKMGIEDAARAAIALKRGEGKRLTWRRTDEA